MLRVSIEMGHWGKDLLRHRVMVLHQNLSLLCSELLLVDGHELLFIDARGVQDMRWDHVTRGLRKRTLWHAWCVEHSLLLRLDALLELLV